MADKKIDGSVEITGKLNPNSSGYGFNLPDSSSLTADSEMADTACNQTFSGTKTFDPDKLIATTRMAIKNATNNYNDTPASGSQTYSVLQLAGKNGITVGEINACVGADWNALNLYCRDKDNNVKTLEFVASGISGATHIYRFNPTANASIDLGASSRRWKDGYFSGTVKIQTTSSSTAGVLSFYNDTTQQGAIRSSASTTSTALVYLTQDHYFRNLSNASGLRIDTTNSVFVPEATNTWSLGTSSAKWKDLYLSGGADVATTIESANLRISAVKANSSSCGIYFQNQSNTRNNMAIRFVTGNANGNGIVIGDGGATLVGAGESAGSYASIWSGATGENLYLTADDSIYLYSNCNTVANRKEVSIKDGAISANNVKTWRIGSDTASTSGWYKFLSTDIYQYADFNMLLAVSQDYSGVNTGILRIHARNNTDGGAPATELKLQWLCRSGLNEASVIGVCSANHVDFYFNVATTQWSGITFSILSEAGRRDEATYTVHASTSPESTAPTATFTSADAKVYNLIPTSINTYSLGSSSLKWKNLYLTSTAYIPKLNNGADISVPTEAGILALTKNVVPVYRTFSSTAWAGVTKGYYLICAKTTSCQISWPGNSYTIPGMALMSFSSSGIKIISSTGTQICNYTSYQDGYTLTLNNGIAVYLGA